jgi:3D (Asp-Asp-Asp) domain-containing protein
VNTFERLFPAAAKRLSPGEVSDGAAAFDDAPKANRDVVLRRVSLALAVALAACATASAPAMAPPKLGPSLLALALDFALPAPAPQDLGPELQLWATHYHTPEFHVAAASESDAIALINTKGEAISPLLRRADWCAAALQGSVSVKRGAKTTAYVFVDDDGPEQTNCDDQLGHLSNGVKRATRRARFMSVDHPLGCGVRNIPLMPFRTAAVDTGVIPLESVLYVPALRGLAFRYKDQTYLHDGYLFAGDRGGAIHGKHIDVFMTANDAGPFEALFTSASSTTFSAYIIAADDPAAVAVKANHSNQCEETPVTPG